jgi:RNA polymerase sigma factor for flagellar operon FliA
MFDPGQNAQLNDAASQWWHDWRERSDSGARERLLLHYQRFARIMAAKLYGQHLYKVLEFDDYLQYAHIGLIEALDRFDPDCGVMFETYSASRIRGAILDGVRRSSEVQEQISARRRLADERVESFKEAPAADGMEQLFKRLAEMAIGLAVGFALEGTGMYQGAETGTDGAYQGIELAQLGQRLRSLVRTLPEAHRAVIVGHYLEHQNFAAIAAHLQVSRSRVAQLHKEALLKLRQMLQQQGISDFSC